MAKSGQRRAYVDETVQDTLPTEELRVYDRPDIDLDSSIDAAYARNGIYFNPQFFRDLAAVSDDIHDTRRFSNALQFQAGLDTQETQRKEELQQMERNLIRARMAELTEGKIQTKVDVTTAMEEAKRNGTSVQAALEKLQPKLDKQTEIMYNRSPFLGEKFSAFKDDYLANMYSTSISTDAVIAEVKSRVQVEDAFALGLEGMITRNESFEQYLADMPPMVFDNIDQISDDKEHALINKGYNMGFLVDAQKIEAQVKAGIITPEEGKTALYDRMHRYQRYNLTGTTRDGDEATVKCFLEPDTMEKVKSIAAGLDEKRNKINAVYTAEAYLQKVGYDYAEKGEFDKIYYYNNTNLYSATQDYLQARAALVAAAGEGNEAAIKQLYKIDKHFFSVVRPQVAIREYLRKRQAEVGSIDEALRDFQGRINSVKNRLRTGDSLENVPELTWTSKDGDLYLSLAYPQIGTDPNYESFLQRSGVTGYDARNNYYQDLVRNAELFLTQAQTSDLLVNLDSSYAAAMDRVANDMTYSYLVREDAQTGTVAINQEGVQRLSQTISQAKLAERSAAGNSVVSAASKKMLTDITDKAKNLNVKQKAFYYQAISKAYTQAGVHDAFVFYKTPALTNDQKDAQKQLAMWSFFDKTPELRSVQNQIMANLVGGEYPNPSLSQANTILKDRISNAKEASFSEEIQRRFNEYNIPVDFQPALRYALTQAAVASVAQGDSKRDLTFDANLIDRVLDANFTKNGTYRYSSTLMGSDVDALDNNILSAQEMIKTGAKKLGINGDITSRVDYETGQIKMYVNGQPLTGTGTYTPLSGSGIVPFALDANAKPDEMPQQKYNDAQSVLVGGATMLMGLSRIDTSPTVQQYVEKYGGGMTTEQAKTYAYSLINVMNDPSVQRGYFSWYNSNYENTKVIAAPTELKNLIVDSMLADKPGSQVPGGAKIIESLAHINPIFGLGAETITRTADFMQDRFGLDNKLNASRLTRDQLNHFVDYMYTRANQRNMVRMDLPMSTSWESNGFPYMNVSKQVENCGHGWYISSSVSGVHEKDSRHYKGYAIDIGVRGGFYQAYDRYNNLKPGMFESLVEGAIKPWNDAGVIEKIYTSNPDLLPGGSDPQYAKYRAMKNYKGEPLFQYARDHSDHFHVAFNKQVYNPKTGLPLGKDPGVLKREVSNTIYTNMNSKGSIGFINRNESTALTTLFWGYKPTDWDARNTGRSLKDLTDSPMTRITAATAKYIRGKNALGSADKAVAGMYGAKFKLVVTNPASKSVKQPDKTYTLEEVINASTRGLSTGRGRSDYMWVIADTQNKKKYDDAINRFVRAGR